MVGSVDEGPVILGVGGGTQKPMGFLDAIHDIQIKHGQEMREAAIPDDYFTWKRQVEFWEVGCKSTLWGGLVDIIIIPLGIGVIDKIIPIFGNSNPSTGDKAIALLLATVISVTYAILLGKLGFLYEGRYTKHAIRNFIGGVVASGLVKIVVGVIAYHYLAFVVLTENRLAEILLLLQNRWFSISTATLNSWYSFLLHFKVTLVASSYFLVITTLICLCIPYICIIIKKWQGRKYSLEKDGVGF